MFAAMKKSETFSGPTDPTLQQKAGITYNATSHGTSGPIYMSYPGYTIPEVGAWSVATSNIGIANTTDAYGGQNWGSYVATSCLNPTNWTRSYSRTGYLDSLPPRPNYDVLANAHVTRLLWNSSSPSSNLSAYGVEYALKGQTQWLAVGVNKEVILAGGSVGSPAVLLYSGVGPRDVLNAAGVSVVSNLPGVGQHLQDHLSCSLIWTTEVETAGTIYAGNGALKNEATFLSYVNGAVAYANASALFGNGLADLHGQVQSQIDQYVPNTSADVGVIAGYKAIYNTTANTILTSQTGQIELVIGLTTNGAIQIGANLQHPFSHGAITINSANPLDDPIINPNYLNHPADVQMLREGVKMARRLGNAEPLASSLNMEVWPGTSVQTDEEWDRFLRGNLFTEYHPSSTCAMLPREQGGVVDTNLRVYGLANVRVADASVPPISFAAHLMAPTYGIAEQASDIIRAYYNASHPTRNNGLDSNDTSNAQGNATDVFLPFNISAGTRLSTHALLLFAATATFGSMFLLLR